ncbi:MAG: AraC family transcriptional regulator [Prevotella sp.]|nr:AraC family transcriptional regulator [Prevotella sp.]
MDLLEQISPQFILFFILYGVTGAVPLIAALYLLLRRGNAIAPGITPPVRLRRWAASFFAMAALGHVWWYLLYVYSRDLMSMDGVVHSAGYVAVAVLDCVTLLTTLAGTLLSMLQDRRRPMWPVFVAMLPFVALGGVLMVHPSQQAMLIAEVYVLLLYALFTVYMVFAVRRYGRWLNDNYADLENKKVWLCQVVTLACLLLFILYTLVDIDTTLLIFLLHFTELVLFGLLLWRVETLPQLEDNSLTPNPSPKSEGSEYPQGQERTEELSTPLALRRGGGGQAPINIDLAQIERLLAEHCVGTQLYLQHDLTVHQLALAIGTNRLYLNQYFSRQGITYNTYINNLRINHFISRYQEAAQAGQPFTAQQLASESGYRSYSTFSLAFKQRTGQSVTAWMRDSD